MEHKLELELTEKAALELALQEARLSVDDVRRCEAVLSEKVMALQDANADLAEKLSKEDSRFRLLVAPLEEEIHCQNLKISEMQFEAQKQDVRCKTAERRNDFLEASSKELTETVKVCTGRWLCWVCVRV